MLFLLLHGGKQSHLQATWCDATTGGQWMPSNMLSHLMPLSSLLRSTPHLNWPSRIPPSRGTTPPGSAPKPLFPRDMGHPARKQPATSSTAPAIGRRRSNHLGAAPRLLWFARHPSHGPPSHRRAGLRVLQIALTLLLPAGGLPDSPSPVRDHINSAR